MPRRSKKVFFASLAVGLVLASGPRCLAQGGDSGVAEQSEFAEIAKLIDDGALLPARSRVETLLQRYPGDWRVALLAARVYRKMGLSGFAAMQYEKVRAHDPRMVEALVALSQIHLENLSTEIAIVLARQAVEIDPKSKEARLALVDALLAGQFLRQARDQAQALNNMYPADADVAHTLAGVAQAFSEYDEATVLLLRALAARPEKVTWRLELADIYQAEGRYQDCQNTLKQILESDPRSLEALNKLAHLQEFDMHEYMPALRSYRAIKEIIPDSAAAQAGIDRCFAKQSDLALNFRNALYRIFGLKIRDAKLEETGDLPVSF
ncbi:MAG: tetratricopeptide repeat protein [Cyanobacteria bacterium SZAS TMP-1]|nr:tetratricopeptide repeat protein [Cyanobacteria bacterium SZAS TMP-1]